MRALLSILVSLCILVNSTMPAFAQLRPIVKGATNAEKAAATAAKQTERTVATVTRTMERTLTPALKNVGMSSINRSLSTPTMIEGFGAAQQAQMLRLQESLSHSVQTTPVAVGENTALRSLSSSSPLANPTVNLSDATPASGQTATLQLQGSDHIVNLLKENVSPAQKENALQFYRTDLSKNTPALQAIRGQQAQKVIAKNSPQAQEVRAAISDAAGIGLLGGNAADAESLIQFHESAANGPFEYEATLITGRSLLRMEAYDAFNTWAAPLKKEGQFWEDLATYAKEKALPVQINVQKGGTAFHVPEEVGTWLKEGSTVNAMSVDGSRAATESWINLGRETTPAPVKAAVAPRAGISVAEVPGVATTPGVESLDDLAALIAGGEATEPAVEIAEAQAAISPMVDVDQSLAAATASAHAPSAPNFSSAGGASSASSSGGSSAGSGASSVASATVKQTGTPAVRATSGGSDASSVTFLTGSPAPVASATFAPTLGGKTMEIDGKLHMVPTGYRYVRVGPELKLVGADRSLKEIAAKEGVPVRQVREVRNGERTLQTAAAPKVSYSTGGGAIGSTGSQIRLSPEANAIEREPVSSYEPSTTGDVRHSIYRYDPTLRNTMDTETVGGYVRISQPTPAPRSFGQRIRAVGQAVKDKTQWGLAGLSRAGSSVLRSLKTWTGAGAISVIMGFAPMDAALVQGTAPAAQPITMEWVSSELVGEAGKNGARGARASRTTSLALSNAAPVTGIAQTPATTSQTTRIMPLMVRKLSTGLPRVAAAVTAATMVAEIPASGILYSSLIGNPNWWVRKAQQAKAFFSTLFAKAEKTAVPVTDEKGFFNLNAPTETMIAGVPAAAPVRASVSRGTQETVEDSATVEGSKEIVQPAMVGHKEKPVKEVHITPEQRAALRADYAVAKEKVNTHYTGAKYAETVGYALTTVYESAVRKFVTEYGEVPSLANTQFQELLTETMRHELEKGAKTTKSLTQAVQQDVLSVFKDSLDPTKEIAPAATVNNSLWYKIKTKVFNIKSADARHAERVKFDALLAQFPGLEASFPIDLEVAKGVTVPENFSLTFKFADEGTKKAFFKTVAKLNSERFVLRTDGGLILRSTSGAERGIIGVFFEGGQGAGSKIYTALATQQMAPRLAVATTERAMLDTVAEYREALNAVLSNDFKAAHPALTKFLGAKASEADAARQTFAKSGQVMATGKALQNELKGMMAATHNTPIAINLFTDKVGEAAQILTAVSEGMSSVGQAITAALKLLGVEKGVLSQLPTTAGQFGPATSPLIGGLQSKLGGKHTLYVGQVLSSVGNAIAMGSLILGATGALAPMATFGGMVGGILLNGIAGNGILKQSNVPLAKERANDPISASAIAADLNSWASVGGMYCYLFLPIVGGLTTLLFGQAVGLGTLAAMFGISAATPLLASVLMRASKIQNVKEAASGAKGYWATIGDNLKFGFKSKSLLGMVGRVAGYHFAGMAFNSGPGAYFKAIFDSPSMAMGASFLSVYLTVFLGRKIGANMMKKGIISDKALIGASSLIALGAGAASILPGIGWIPRSILWAVAGLGFANLANMEQAIELNRPANVGHKAAVSTMYVLARMSGMLTFVMGMFADGIAKGLGVSPAMSMVYALSLPLLTLGGATIANWSYIKDDLFGTQMKQWFTRAPKGLVYSTLRKEVEAAMIKNPTWGTSLPTEISEDLAFQVAAGINSRYAVDLSTLEKIRMALEDKAGLDIHRLDMARKLAAKRLAAPSTVGEPLTYDAFRNEVEPLYTSVIMARATGVDEAIINNMIHSTLNAIIAKYIVTDTEIELIIAKLSRRTALNRNRLSVLDHLYALQLQADAEAEITSQLKKASPEDNKSEIIRHILEKYQGIADARGIILMPPALAQ